MAQHRDTFASDVLLNWPIQSDSTLGLTSPLIFDPSAVWAPTSLVDPATGLAVEDAFPAVARTKSYFARLADGGYSHIGHYDIGLISTALPTVAADSVVVLDDPHGYLAGDVFYIWVYLSDQTPSLAGIQVAIASAYNAFTFSPPINVTNAGTAFACVPIRSYIRSEAAETTVGNLQMMAGNRHKVILHTDSAGPTDAGSLATELVPAPKGSPGPVMAALPDGSLPGGYFANGTVLVGNPTTIILDRPHRWSNSGTFTVSLDDFTPAITAINGYRVATVTGTNTFTIPVDSSGPGESYSAGIVSGTPPRTYPNGRFAEGRICHVRSSEQGVFTYRVIHHVPEGEVHRLTRLILHSDGAEEAGIGLADDDAGTNYEDLWRLQSSATDSIFLEVDVVGPKMVVVRAINTVDDQQLPTGYIEGHVNAGGVRALNYMQDAAEADYTPTGNEHEWQSFDVGGYIDVADGNNALVELLNVPLHPQGNTPAYSYIIDWAYLRLETGDPGTAHVEFGAAIPGSMIVELGTGPKLTSRFTDGLMTNATLAYDLFLRGPVGSAVSAICRVKGRRCASPTIPVT